VVLGRVGPADEAPEGGVAATLALDAVEDRAADTAEIPVLGGTRGRSAQAAAEAPAARAPRVLEPVSRRRSRRKPLLVGVLVLAAAAAGTLAWIGSRTYTLQETDEGTVAVEHGLPWEIPGLSLSSSWQDTGVPADVAREGSPDALGGGWHGLGEAVQVASGLVWRHGLPELTPLQPPAAGAIVPAEGSVPTG
jgi:hypothetical protein